MMRPRYLILTDDSRPATGGVAEYLHQLAAALAPTHDVVIASGIAGAAAVDAPAGVRYVEAPSWRTQLALPGDARRLTRRWNTLRWMLTRRRMIRRRLLELLSSGGETRVIIGRLSVATHPWCVTCRALGVPYAAIGYGLELVEPGSGAQRRARRRDALAAAHWLSISADTTALLTAVGVPADRVTLVPPGASAESVTAPDAAVRRRVRARLGLGEAPFVLSLGMLRARKGFDLTIDALDRLRDRYPALALVIAGDGPEAVALRAHAARSGVGDRIHFTGVIDDETRNALLAECALFVLANRRLPGDVEGFGIVFLEAALHGKAVIGGRNGGVVDAVADGETGLLVDTTGDAAPLAAALARLLDDPALAHALGARGRARAQAEFSWSARAATVVSVVDRIGVAR